MTLAFQTAAAGTGKTVTISSVTLAGADAGAYTVNLTGAPTTTANITQKPVTVGGSFAAANKVYDGSASATITSSSLTLSGVLGSDDVSLTAVTAAFGSATVGTAKPVSLASAQLTGAQAGNYALSLTGAPTTTATISTAGGTVTLGGTFTANNKVYDGTTAATGTTGALTLAGIAGSDDVRIASVTLAFQTAAAGTGKTVTISSVTLAGADAGAYTVSLTGAPTTTASIMPRTLTLSGSFTASNKSYDGSTSATIATSGLTLAGILGNDQVVLGSVLATFDDTAVGANKAVSISGVTLSGAHAFNYVVDMSSAPRAAASIEQRLLTISGTFQAYEKDYDGTTVATGNTSGLILVGRAGTEQVGIASVQLAFQTPAAGTSKLVSITGLSLSGSDAGSYTVSLATAPAATATIRPRAVVLEGRFTATDKVYDGTTSASIKESTLQLRGIVPGDQLQITQLRVAFDDSRVGVDKPVRLLGAVLGGPSAANYLLANPAIPSALAAITSRPLDIIGSFSVSQKIFDGTATADMQSSAIALRGLIGNDEVRVTGLLAEFDSPAVGSSKTVFLRGGQLVGTAAANYHLTVGASRPTAIGEIIAATPPSAPQKIRATVVDGQIQVAWDIPTSEGCRAVTGYVMSVSTDDGISWSQQRLEGRAALALALTAVELNIRHRIRIAAVNQCGMSDWATVSDDVVPVKPVVDGSGRPTLITPTTTIGNGPNGTVTMRVAADTAVSVVSGSISLALTATDERGEALHVDSTGSMLLEQGGRVWSTGTGFAPGTYATLYLFPTSGASTMLAMVLVKTDGTFDIHGRLASDLTPGEYIVQVNGRDAKRMLRSVSLAVEVAEPPPELVLTSVPSVKEPAVGDTITLTLTVTNSGNGSALDVVIPRAFDEQGFRLVQAAAEQGVFRADRREWTITRIAARGQARLVLTVVVLHTEHNGGQGR